LQLKDKARGDILNICKDPTGKFGMMITTVSKLLSGSDDSKAEARRSIENMPSKNLTKATKHDEKHIKRVMERLSREYKLQDKGTASKAWSDLEQVIPTDTNITQSSSLLQTEGQTSYGIDSLVVAIVLILILILILPGLGGVIGTLFTIVIALLVLILIMMLVMILIGHIRGLGGDNRRRHQSNNRGNNRQGKKR